VALDTRSAIGPIIDCNVHLWDQRDNPVFWLSDRTVVRDMPGDYDSLPDSYTLSDYRRETSGHDVRGLIWSDAGAADPLAAADWVSRQHDGVPPVIAMVTLGDPTSAAFADLVEGCRQRPLIRSIRMRLVPELSGRAPGDGDLLDDRIVPGQPGLTGQQWPGRDDRGDVRPARYRDPAVGTVPALRIVIDHFGWRRPAWAARASPGTSSASPAWPRPATWRPGSTPSAPSSATGPSLRYAPGCSRWPAPSARNGACSDLPIENLRSGFGPLYAAYDAIFSDFSDNERAMLFRRTAERWYARGDR
jgi:hypothetical protein